MSDIGTGSDPETPYAVQCRPAGRDDVTACVDELNLGAGARAQSRFANSDGLELAIAMTRKR